MSGEQSEPETQPEKPEGSSNRFAAYLTTERIIRGWIGVLLVAVSLFMNDRQFLIWGLIAALTVVFVPTGRARYFVAGIVPYASAWFAFSFLRSFADETLFAKTLNLEVFKFELWVFNGQLPTVTLQSRFLHVHDLNWWDYYLTFIHWSYFLIPHSVALWLWWKHKRAFQHYLLALTMTLFLGLVIYFIIPANPPWMSPPPIDSPSAPYVLRPMEQIALSIGGGLYQAGYKIVGESNPIAAMPSMHFAITFILVWVARGRGRYWEILAWLYALSMGLALVYLGEHYVIDIVVGGGVTTFSWFATKSWMNSNMVELEPTEIRGEAEPELVPATT